MESSSMVPVNKQSSVADASSSSKGKASVHVIRIVAERSYEWFESGNYTQCLQFLSGLLNKRADDPKILHNIVVAKSTQDGFSNPKRFLEALISIKKRIETLSDQVPVTDSSGTVSNLDVSVITFNIAVTLYHLHEYEKCFAILEQLYQNIQSIDEVVGRKICVFLLDVALICHRVSLAIDVIDYLERSTSNILTTKSTPTPGNQTVQDSINPENSLSQNLSEESLHKSLTPNPDKNESPNHTEPCKDLDISVHDLRLKLHLYKVRVLLFTGHLKAAKHEVKTAMNVARGKEYTQKDYCSALFIKSQFEYVRSNHQKAIKLMVASTGQIGQTGQVNIENLSLCYNNLGCIYYRLGQFEISSGFFLKALRICSNFRKQQEGPVKLLNISRDKSILFLYNCGLVYLASGNPLLAFRCFQKVGPVFFKRPVFWLRVAECCIMALEKKPDISINVVGSGKWRQLVIENPGLKNGSKADPNLSLTYAKSCLVNVLYLIDSSNGSSGLDPDENPFSETGQVENRVILQAALADLAFVYLELGNAMKVLTTVKRLLKLPECSRMYVFYGNIYAAEAYCLLNRPKQASEHLSGYISGPQNNVDFPYNKDDSGSFFLDSKQARGYLYADMAAMLAAQGDIQRAHEAAELALSALPDSPEIVLTATYVNLVRGDTREAIEKLKRYSRVRFVSGN